jgi:hypothetical protein
VSSSGKSLSFVASFSYDVLFRYFVNNLRCPVDLTQLALSCIGAVQAAASAAAAGKRTHTHGCVIAVLFADVTLRVASHHLLFLLLRRSRCRCRRGRTARCVSSNYVFCRVIDSSSNRFVVWFADRRSDVLTTSDLALTSTPSSSIAFRRLQFESLDSAIGGRQRTAQRRSAVPIVAVDCDSMIDIDVRFFVCFLM